MDDIFVYLTDLPDGIREMVTPCLDGYTVYIDARQSREECQKAYMHALQHIRNHDFEKDDVQEIEAKAHLCREDTDAL